LILVGYEKKLAYDSYPRFEDRWGGDGIFPTSANSQPIGGFPVGLRGFGGFGSSTYSGAAAGAQSFPVGGFGASSAQAGASSFSFAMPKSGVGLSFASRGHLTTTRRMQFPSRFQEPQEPVIRKLFPETWLFESISDLG
jgi:hypothetical protein